MTLHPVGPLIVEGAPRLGRFADTLGPINAADFVYLDPFGRPYGRVAKRMHYKRFQYFGGMSDRLVFGCALADLRYIAAAFVYVYDFASGKLFSRSIRLPLGLGLRLGDNPLGGVSELRLPGVLLRMDYSDSPRRKRLQVRLGNTLRIDATMPETNFEPMSLCTRTAYQGWVYANKTAGLRLEGQLHLEGKDYDLRQLDACGHHDFSCGYMRRETFWNWACFSGVSQGHRLGLNVSCGVNETSFTENCLWIDGQLVKINLVQFEFDRAMPLQPWRVHSDDGLIDLEFVPSGMHQERLDAVIMASNFKQVFGHFRGELRLPQGTLMIDGMPGFVEDQFARW